MSEPVTEIVIIPLVAGTDLKSGATKETWDSAMQMLASQPGCKVVRWGTQVENPEVVQLAIDWDQLSSHETFISAPAYTPFLAKLQPLMAGDPHLYHLRIAPNSAPLDAPTTECVSLYFPSDYASSTYDVNWKKFLDAAAEEAAKMPGEFFGIEGGWSVEPHECEGVGKDAKFFGGFLGWPTVEAHMEFRKREVFPGIVKHLRDGPAVVKMYHVHFTRV